MGCWKNAFFYFITLIVNTLETPFIFDSSIETCSYFMKSAPFYYDTTSVTFGVMKSNKIKIAFKLCGTFLIDDECPNGTTVCLINYNTKEKISLGTKFELDNNSLMKSIKGEPCKGNKMYELIVDLKSSSKKPRYLKTENDNCTYHVEIYQPKSTASNCGLIVDGRFLDLSALAKTFNVQTSERNFSIALCDSDSECGTEHVGGCEIKGTTKTPIFEKSSLQAHYVGEKNQIVFHGSTHIGPANKIDKRFELILRCDWDKTEIHNNDFSYMPKPIQGKKYSFTLETSYGCIKKSANCVVHDEFLIYNLSNLYAKHPEMWSTEGPTLGPKSTYFLQICGSGNFAGRNTNCKKTYAQVCENVNGSDINRGSVLTHLEVVNNALRATIDSGAKCREATSPQDYKSIIDFHCGLEEMGPKFVSRDNCNTRFQWTTPEACPKYNSSKCSYVQVDFHGCIYKVNRNRYNFTALNFTQIIANEKKHIEFKLNLCGPVLDEDVPCMKDVNVMEKNLSDFSVHSRVISLGKYQDSEIINDTLVMRYSAGSYRDGCDYRSEIRIECANVEEQPVLSHQDTCFYSFLWKTKHGCPVAINKHEELRVSPRSCSFQDSVTGKSIDFKDIRPIKFTGKQFNKTVDICRKVYVNCSLSEEECVEVPLENPVVKSLKNVTILEITTSNTCSFADDFNKVTFNVFCDKVKNNQHVKSINKNGCDVTLDLFTDAVCPYQEISEDNSNVQSEELQKTKYSVERSPVVQTNECSIVSPFTNHTLDIHNFSIIFFKGNCPVVTFNSTFRYVNLFYSSTDVCRLFPSRNISYQVYLMCSSKDKPILDEECLQLYSYQQPEYCKFFRSEGTSKAIVVTSSIVGSLAIFSLICLAIFMFVTRKKSDCRSRQYVGIYERDSQM